MELPSYHLPQFRNVVAHLWEKLKHYVIKAATIIAASLVVIWFLSSFGWAFWNGLVDINDSMLADIGKVFGYLFYPMGFSWDVASGAEPAWFYSVASVTGLVAKEDVVGTLGSLFNIADAAEDEVGALINLSGPAVWSYAVFNLFTIPCFAAIAAAHGEQKGKEFWLTLLWWFAMSYVSATVVFWIGKLFVAALWAGILVVVLLAGGVVAAGIIVSRRHKLAALAAQ